MINNLLTSPLANVPFGGSGFVEQNHSHGNCSIWDKVVKETRHMQGTTKLEMHTDCWTYLCTYR